MNGQPVNYGGLFAATLCAFHVGTDNLKPWT